ncbi:tctex1 domain-containing protein 4 isoform X1 [Anguilla anguilla]|uniref:tctex1 domain-containing protein 4 isoform X1 n=2 Tax=Anguilla anguilla TaxID=7936 RepID=UPI0015A86A76|nr:tctex1 domain-containing protein 4 isoform X1 [Anguilla anguilla]
MGGRERFAMATQQLPLSQEVLAQFDHAQSGEAGALLRRRKGSVSTRRSSQSVDPLHARPLPQLLIRGPEAGAGPPGPSSRRNSVFSVPSSPFPRRESLALGRRLSVAAWAPSRQVSFSGLPLPQPARETCLENTYRTGPDQGCRFDAERVQRVVQDALDGYLGDARYNAATAGPLSQNLSDLVRGKARDVTPRRYKLACLVVLGQSGTQGLQVASRCLWDTESDNSAVAVFRNPSLFAVAVVHGVYCE